jgi:hypothetical protein
MASFNILKMNYSKLQIPVKIILLCSVMFFSTGFTAVVKYCSMSQSSECCCESAHANDTTPPSDVPSLRDQNSSCLTIKIIGGLNEIKATLTSDASENLHILETVPLSSDGLLLPAPTRFLAFTYSNNIAPPNGDICIRIGVLLI